MKTTYITTTAELLELAVRLGFDKERALEDIDACLDETLGFENRKDMSEEVLEKELIDDIITGFQCEKDITELEINYIEWLMACDNLDQDTDCGDINNRKDFSNFANLDEEISFDEMLELERNYR
ncbi:MAG: hypothetical protein KHX14_05900 [[Clostridium] spiroforme]|uniref:Uncharacterized protein n=1 Tax=Thomasclavelia spiroformis TaxID=29348 RepID=A0A943I3B0_9FIRM|nr:hypothetical protein [Thomasclavelia spiroformis]MBS5588338.1 hypothetical protein [Thomasclavelia spiroformis]